MAESHYTRQELFILRNHIPVDSLIKKLNIPSKIIEGHFRFCCPLCNEFNASVNSKTNLARCFDCRKNYNTIPPNSLPTERPSSAQPVSIGEIFKAMGTEGGSVSKNQKTNDNQPFHQLNERIIQLEQKVAYLTQRLKVIELNS